MSKSESEGEGGEEEELKTMTKQEFKAMEEVAEKLRTLTPEQFLKKLETLPLEQAAITAISVSHMKNMFEIESLTRRVDRLEQDMRDIAKDVIGRVEEIQRILSKYDR
jgi:hypothetical protein